MKTYFDNITSVYDKNVTIEEQNNLVVKAQNGDIQSLHKLIHSILPLIIRKAKSRFGYQWIPDVVNDCVLKVMSVIKNFDINKNDNFLSYIAIIIDNFLTDFFINARSYHHNWLKVKLPYSTGRKIHKNWDFVVSPNVTPRHVAEKLNISLKLAKDVFDFCHSTACIKDASQDMKISKEDNIPSKPCLADLIELVDECFSGEYHSVVRALVENHDEIHAASSQTGVDTDKVVWYKRKYKRELKSVLKQRQRGKDVIRHESTTCAAYSGFNC